MFNPIVGCSADMAVIFALLGVGRSHLWAWLWTTAVISPTAGTYPCRVNGSNQLFTALIRKQAEIDYDNVSGWTERRPKLLISGAAAYSRVIDFEKFPQDCRQCRCVYDGPALFLTSPDSLWQACILMPFHTRMWLQPLLIRHYADQEPVSSCVRKICPKPLTGQFFLVSKGVR